MTTNLKFKADTVIPYNNQKGYNLSKTKTLCRIQQTHVRKFPELVLPKVALRGDDNQYVKKSSYKNRVQTTIPC